MRHCDKRAVTINPTNKCNLRCEYCMASSAEEQDNPIVISRDFAFAGIKDAIDGEPTGIKAESLRFFSPGEPTQAMHIIKDCVEYARSLNPDIKVELQTNGLFETREDTEWIADNIDVVWFSLDGPATINDKHRPDAFGKGRTAEIEENMKIVQQKAFVGVRATVVEEMLNRQVDLVAYYYALGVEYIGLNPIIRPIKRRETETEIVTKSDIMTFAENFADAYELGAELGAKVLSSLTFNFDSVAKVACRSCLPMPQLNPDGSVSSCDMALYRDSMDALQFFVYGNWFQANRMIMYDMDKIKALQSRTTENLPKCRDCPVLNYCAGGCAGRVAYQTGSLFDIIPEYCKATRYLATRIPLGKNVVEFTHP